MKKKVLAGILTLAIILGAMISFGFKSVSAIAPETQTCYGPTVKTDELHNARCAGIHDNSYGCFDNWLFRKFTLTVTAPAGWHFTGSPSVHCVQDNKGSFGWNNFPGAHDRFFVTQQNPNFIEATVWAGSHAIQINLACQAVKN